MVRGPLGWRLSSRFVWVCLAALAACDCGSPPVTSGTAVPKPVIGPLQRDGRSLAFGKVQVGRTRHVEFLLKNDGRSPLKISNIRPSTEPFPATFGIALPAEIQIEPGATGKIPLSFTPI